MTKNDRAATRRRHGKRWGESNEGWRELFTRYAWRWRQGASKQLAPHLYTAKL